jgi:thiol-disulfide isomerase/thioredoxin
MNLRSSIVFALFASLACEAPSDDGEDTQDTGDPLPTQTERMVLHESFTGSNCGPCQPAAENLARVLDENAGKYTLLKYQTGSDPYVSRESVKRRMYYLPGEEVYSIPFVHADGVNGFHPNEMNGGDGYQQEDFDGFYSVHSTVEMSVTAEVTEQTISWHIEVLPLEDIPAKKMVLHVGIAEGTTYNNVGTNGQTEFHHVMKKMAPNNLGEALGELVRGEPMIIDGSYTFQGEYAEDADYANQVDHDTEHTVEEFEDLGVVVWIQNKKTWEVFQSAWTFGGEETSE